MKFFELALYFQKLENTTSRNAMTEILADLFKKASADEIDKICYLTQGRVAPLFIALELGMAEKMMIKAIALAYGISEKEVGEIFKKEGDMGKVAERLIAEASVADEIFHSESNRSLKEKIIVAHGSLRIPQKNLSTPSASVSEVFLVLEEIAHASGSGSVERKTRLLADLLKKVDSLSARYIVRIPLAKMRLGFSDMTVLDALSWMLGKSKEARKEIEKAYNVRPDLGFIAKTVKIGQIRQIGQIGPEVGTPILMARAERLSSGKEIIEKIGKCVIEPKLDGFRLQVHYSKKGIVRHSGESRQGRDKLRDSRITQVGFWTSQNDESDKVKLFSRNLEDVTLMYPDIVAGAMNQIKAREAIFEGEAIGWDEKKQKYLPFQETVQRRRKYNIKEMTKSVPLKLVVFDLLYVDGENLIDRPFLERRKRLEGILLVKGAEKR